MIRRHASTLRALLMLGDALAALVVLAVVAHVRFGPDWDTALPEELARPGWAILYAAVWVLLLYLEGQYRLRARWTLRSEAVGIVRAGVWFGLLTTSALFLAHAGEVSRLYVVLLFPTQVVVTLVTRATLRWTLSWMRQHGRNVRNILILGDGPRAHEFAAQVEDHSALGLHVVGFLGEGPDATADDPAVLGRLADLQRVLHANVIDEVAVCLATTDWTTVEAIAQLCQEEGKIVRVPLELPALGGGHRFVEDLDGSTVLTLAMGPDRLLALGVKRLFDIVLASIGLLLLAPVLAGISLAIMVTEGRPVFFRQRRLGLNGRRFWLVKFRTMVPDAERRLESLRHLNEMHGQVFKITDDPRITRVGRWLRRTSLDELPQLWNVLRGDMSLVGPRPPLPAEVDAYDVWHRRRLSMKPGITGLWQVQARRGPDFDRWVQKDLEYIDRWSLLLDLRIVLRTIPAVIRLEGR